MRNNRKSIDHFDEDDMPCMCEICGGWFDLMDGLPNPKNDRIVICESCANEIQGEVDRQEEINDLLSSISDAEYTIRDSKQRLEELGYKEPVE